MLTLGYKASAEQFAPNKLLDFSVLAEECGFDSVFVSDHFQPWKHTDGHAPFSLVWLGALGAKTKRVVMDLVFLKPFAATNTTEFTLKPEGNGTAVTWSMAGKNGFMGKAVGLFMNCDKMVGTQFEKGFENLKAVVAAQTK